MGDPEGNIQASDDIPALARLLHMARRARGASTVELGFIAVNETRDLVTYRQAVLWDAHRGALAVSGLAVPEGQAPFLLWLKHVVGHLSAQRDAASPRPFSACDLPDLESAEWADWLPPHALWLPFDVLGQRGGWLLAREEEWSEAEISLLAEWLALWVQPWALRHVEAPRRRWWRDALARRPTRARLREHLRQSLLWLRRLHRPGTWRELGRWLWTTRRGLSLLAVFGALVFPVRLSIMAPGQLVPADPLVVRAPMDGIVERVLVQPGQRVGAGDKLLEFDHAALTARLEATRQALAAAETEYRQAALQFVSEVKSKGQLAALQGRLEEKRAEVAYLEGLNQRAVLTSPREGIALLDEPSEWAGRPVTAGERLMAVADERAAEIEGWLAPGDMIELPVGAEATLYLDTQPLSPVDGILRYVAHDPVARPDGRYAYRLRARLAPGEDVPRIGLTGSVRVAGNYVPLVYWVLRKPLAAARSFVGF